MRPVVQIAVWLSIFLATPVRAEVPSELADALTRWKPLMEEFRIPGMAVVVVRDGEPVLTVGLGRRDPDKDDPVTADTVFFTGSVTRTFVVTVALLLAQEGKLDLDAPVKKYLPTFQLADSSLTEKLTVRDLITQGKGLDNDAISFRVNCVGQLEDGDMDRLLPKTKSSGGYKDEVLHAVILGRVLESCSGKSWKELVRTRLLEPGKMSRTFLSAKDMYAASDAAVPIEDIGGVFYASRFPKTDGTMHAGGGMGSSAADLAQWLAINMKNDGRIVPTSVFESMHSPQITLNSQMFLIWRESYGWGWNVGSYAGKRLVHELGGTVGARSHVSFMPTERLGVVALANVGGVKGLFLEAVACDVYNRMLKLGGDDPFVKLREFLSKNLKGSPTTEVSSRARPAEGAGLSLPIAAYLGRYVHDDWGTLEVSQKEGELFLSLGEFRMEVRTAGVDHFEFDMAGGVKHGQFLLGPNRKVIAAELQINLLHHSFTKK